MMMPANYSVIAENEMTYVVGGGLLEAIGSVTAPVWGAANVKTFNTNLLTIVGNSYVSSLVKGTLGVMFGGNWGGEGANSSIFGGDGILSNVVKYGSTSAGTKEINGFNKFMQVVGLSAAVYQLGTSEAKTVVGNAKVLGTNGKWDKF